MNKSLLSGTYIANFAFRYNRTKPIIGMKTRFTMALIAMGISFVALAQDSDDMYFNSKDRAKLVSATGVILAKQYQQEDIQSVRTNPVNPSDSYSGRGVNPEYNAQAKNGTTVLQNN